MYIVKHRFVLLKSLCYNQTLYHLKYITLVNIRLSMQTYVIQNNNRSYNEQTLEKQFLKYVKYGN